MYTAIKTHKLAFEPRASQSKALVAAKPQYHAPTPNMRYRPPAKKNPVKTGFRKGYSILLLGETLGLAMPRLHLPTVHARIAIRQDIGKATAHTCRRRPIRPTSIRDVFTTLPLKKFLLVR